MLGELLHDAIAAINGHPLLSLGVLILAGYVFGRLCQLLRLPTITGYIVAGLVVSDSVAGIVDHHTVASLAPITEVALSFIAITIGGEFHFAKLRRTGGKILAITLFEAIFAAVMVSTVLGFLLLPFSYALLLGAIAAATAPAATVVIVRDLRARGEFVDYLFGVVAFDDAVSVLLFSIGFAVVTPLLMGGATDGAGILVAFGHGVAEIGLSALAGVVSGLVIHVVAGRRRPDNEVLLITLGVLFAATAGVLLLGLSALIANMCTGVVLVNLAARNRRVFAALEPITAPVFALFFILAGAELDLSVVGQGLVVVLGLVYLAARFAGKMAGVTVGSLVVRAPANVRRYLGFCLFPQAGVAIGLAMVVQGSALFVDAPEAVREMLRLLTNVVLFSVFVNELIGPLISRFGIVRGTARL
ncbi:MAG: cation:proton antiporter [Spirochaetaceae bacterium]|nr:cation:proton antiporter [Spirochaetaceae bacterium]